MKTGGIRGIPVFLGAIALLAVAVRLTPWQGVFDQGTVYFFDGDCYLHIRKVLLHVASFPRFVSFDYFDGFPDGTVALWPPVLDWLISLLSIISGQGNSARGIEVLSALIPPVVGGLTVIALYVFGRRIFDPPTALIAGALLSFMYGHVVFTILGRPDNEMMEPLMALLMYASYTRLQFDSGGSRIRDIALSAVSAFGLLMFWRGGTLWVILLWAAMLIDVTLDFVTARQGRARHKEGAMVFALLALMIAPMCAFDIWGRQNSFSFNVISWFHVLVFGGAALLLQAYGWAARAWRATGRGVAGFFVTVIVGTLGLVGTSLAVPLLRENLVSGVGILGIGRTDPWIQSIEEYRPLFSADSNVPMAAVGYAGWFYWLMPAALAHILWRMWRARSLDRPKIFFMFFVLAVIALSALRIRFVHIMSVGAALSGAYMLMVLYRTIASGRSGRLSIPGVLAAALVAVALIYPSVKHDYYLTLKHPGFKIKGYMEDAMLWMRDTTPMPLGAGQGGRPSYGVMAMWDLAGWIERVAERPAVATLYGTETSGLREAAEFFLSEDADGAAKVLNATGARYVIATQVISELPVLARVLGRNDADYVETVFSEEARQKVHRPGPRYMGLVSTALLLWDGAESALAGTNFKPVGHMRLVYESPYTLKLRNFPHPVSKLKIFEYVPGVNLKVRAAPGSEVAVSASVRTNLGREFQYALRAKADKDGMALFNLPYASPETANITGLSTPYTVRSGARSLALSIADGDVIAGAAIRAELL